jgi:hypothetical protein
MKVYAILILILILIYLFINRKEEHFSTVNTQSTDNTSSDYAMVMRDLSLVGTTVQANRSDDSIRGLDKKKGIYVEECPDNNRIPETNNMFCNNTNVLLHPKSLYKISFNGYRIGLSKTHQDIGTVLSRGRMNLSDAINMCNKNNACRGLSFVHQTSNNRMRPTDNNVIFYSSLNYDDPESKQIKSGNPNNILLFKNNRKYNIMNGVKAVDDDDMKKVYDSYTGTKYTDTDTDTTISNKTHNVTITFRSNTKCMSFININNGFMNHTGTHGADQPVIIRPENATRKHSLYIVFEPNNTVVNDINIAAAFSIDGSIVYMTNSNVKPIILKNAKIGDQARGHLTLKIIDSTIKNKKYTEETSNTEILSGNMLTLDPRTRVTAPSIKFKLPPDYYSTNNTKPDSEKYIFAIKISMDDII